MIVKQIILENFSGIETGMGVHKLTINFPINGNKIYLITAPNGTGKTTLLSLITPFASLGNLDVRDGYNLIIPEKNGYKEITILDKNNEYVIKHFYTYSKSRGTCSVKSYITKNGDELNPNGNVSSFKELVNIELDLEIDYLKLIRLGTNVTSLIDLSETERKSFMSKLLDDVDIYLSYYKKISKDVNELKTMTSHSSNKLLRLGISNIHEAKKEVNDIEKTISDFKLSHDYYKSQIALAKNEINKIDDIHEIKSNLQSLKTKFNKMTTLMEKKEKDNEQFLSIDEYNRMYLDFEKDISDSESAIAVSNGLISEFLSSVAKLENELNDDKILLSKEQETDNEIENINNEINDYEQKISSYKEILKGFKHTITKTEFEELIVFLKMSYQTISVSYEYGNEIVSTAVSLIKNKTDIHKYMIENLSILNRRTNDDTLDILKKIINDNPINISCNKSVNCNAFRIADSINTIIKSEDHKENDQYTREYYYSIERVYESIVILLKSFAERIDIINKLPPVIRKTISPESLLENISGTKMIYPENTFNMYLSLLTEESVMNDLINKRNELISTLKRLETTSRLGMLIDRINVTKTKIQAYTQKIKENRKNIENNKEKIKKLSESKEYIDYCRDILESYDSIKKEKDELSIIVNSYENNIKTIKDNEIDLNRCDRELARVNNEYIKLKSNIDQYKSIQKELENYSEYYDDLVILKEALSSRKGMPLYYIKMYLNDAREVTNDLLDIVYNGRIYIDNFDPSPDSFRIPFFNRGKYINDVKCASQGERAFISIALSFALSAKSMTKYNIMLLDEIDSTLDSDNREKFIQILDSQIERINCEQCLLISHNDAFNYCPVNLIDLIGEDENILKEKYPLASIVDIKKE